MGLAVSILDCGEKFRLGWRGLVEAGVEGNRSIMAQSDQLRVPDPVRTDPKSFELLRVWVAHQDQHISLRAGVWEDPAAWGTMLADLARHIANAFETYENRD